MNSQGNVFDVEGKKRGNKYFYEMGKLLGFFSGKSAYICAILHFWGAEKGGQAFAQIAVFIPKMYGKKYEKAENLTYI